MLEAMVTWRLLASVAAVALVVVYAVGSSRWVANDSGWYASLAKPSWQPPDLVFGLIWPYNFLALAVVGVVVALRGPGGTVAGWLGVGALSVVAALAWAYLFYVPHRMEAAAVALAVATALTAVLVVITWSVTRWGAVALLPYLVWVGLATSLAVAYPRLNA
jgi:tryptophan-rich sensory protein